MLSVIVPLHNEEENLLLLHNKLLVALQSTRKPYEIIYVDDYSSDGSFEYLKSFLKGGENISIIRMARNQGQTLAMRAGIDHSKGDILVFLDADLQNDPADIPKLLEKIDSGYAVASGWRKVRKDPLFSKRLPSLLGNWLIGCLFGVKLHDVGCTLKACKREVFSRIRLYGEMHRLLPLVFLMKGIPLAEVVVSHSPRYKGKTHYGWGRVYRFLFDLLRIRFFPNSACCPGTEKTYSVKEIIS